MENQVRLMLAKHYIAIMRFHPEYSPLCTDIAEGCGNEFARQFMVMGIWVMHSLVYEVDELIILLKFHLCLLKSCMNSHECDCC